MRSAPTLEDLGLRQQVSLYEAFGGPVIDSSDLLADPEAGLRALCAALSVPFSTSMLSWPAGPRESDGVWAPTAPTASPLNRFRTARTPPRDPFPPELEPLAEQCMPFYQRLSAHRLKFLAALVIGLEAKNAAEVR